MALAHILAPGLVAFETVGDDPVAGCVKVQVYASLAVADAVLDGGFLVDQNLQRIAVFVGGQYHDMNLANLSRHRPQ